MRPTVQNRGSDMTHYPEFHVKHLLSVGNYQMPGDGEQVILRNVGPIEPPDAVVS